MKNDFPREADLAAMAALAALVTLPALHTPAHAAQDVGQYVTGDFHNHSTCSDGQISVQKLVTKSVDTFGLDWFAMAGHGGGGSRNCTLVDDAETALASGYPFDPAVGPSTTWSASIGNARIKGDVAGSDTARTMWRWQSIQEFQYPVVEKMSALKKKPIFMGLESVVAGHEHSNVALVAGQLPANGGGNANAMAMWEYCFDRADGDLSRGAENQWDCTVPGGQRNDLLDARGRKLAGAQNTGTLGHEKTVEAIRWMQALHPRTSYYVPAHVERAGAFNPNGNNGFNIEHFRDFNNAGPSVAFGFEGGPGHQAAGNRSYGSGAVGGGTYGGAGFYTAQVGGVWDALLGEGRNWFIFNNSDYHNRGSFGPDDFASTSDQYPGEFNKTYTLARTGGAALTPQAIVDGMRTGNAWYVNGDLIDRLSFVVCRSNGNSGKENGSFPHEQQVARAAEAGVGFFHSNCAQQGEKLQVNRGDSVVVMAVLRDPEGSNLSPYSFANPSLAQIGVMQPLNQPVLDHVDLIGGKVTGYVAPGSPNYAGPINSPAATNPTTGILASFSGATWKSLPGGWKRMAYRMTVTDSQYVRLRGTNIPAGTPNETDSQGNPLIDTLANNVVCTDPACPAHLPAVPGGRRLDFDVEAWTDLWFYSNPVFIEVKGATQVAGIK